MPSSSSSSLAIPLLALLLGLSHSLLPLFYLQRGFALASSSPANWLFPLLAHSLHHCSSIVGISIGPMLLAKSKFFVPTSSMPSSSPQLAHSTAIHLAGMLLFLAISLKVISLALLTMALCFDPALPSCIFLAPILGVGLSDGITHRLILQNVIHGSCIKQGEHQGRQWYHSNMDMFHFLFLLHFGSFLSALLICPDDFVDDDSQQLSFASFSSSSMFIPQLPIKFIFHPKLVIGCLTIFQAISLFPLLPAKLTNREKEEEEEDEETVPNTNTETSPSPFRMEEKFAREEVMPAGPLVGWALLSPICLISALSSALFGTFPLVLFAFPPSMPSGFSPNQPEFPPLHEDLLLFTSASLFVRLFFALLPKKPSSSRNGTKGWHPHPASSNGFLHLLHLLQSPNALFPIGLFGSGFSLCILNVQFLHPFAVSIYGACLGLLLPAILQFIQQITVRHQPHSGNQSISTVIVALLASSQIGVFLFPFILCQIFRLYDGPQLFSSMAFFAILLMVISFVCLLNAQAEQQQQQQQHHSGAIMHNGTGGGNHSFWGGWFRGEGGRRTRRSIRRFVRNVRGSLRRQKHIGRNRCQRRRRVGTGEAALLEENCPMEGIGIGGGRGANYQSIQTLHDNGLHILHGQILDLEGFKGKATIPLNLRRGKFSLPAIIIHQGTPPSSQSTKSLKGMEEGKP